MDARWWELLVIDAIEGMASPGNLAIGDLYGDGHPEIVVAGEGGLLWYRLGRFERNVIAEGSGFVGGLALEDVDGDGILEVIASRLSPTELRPTIALLKPGRDLREPWSCLAVDPCCTGVAHDFLFTDVDGDGERELVAAAGGRTPGLFVYKRGKEATEPWSRHTVSTGFYAEGLAVGDIDGDGRVEIVLGPDLWSPPAMGPFAGPWRRRTYAPGFREKCRVAVADVTGNGRLDLIIAESEYPDGSISWYENRTVENAADSFVEHEIDRPMKFAHSLDAWARVNPNQTRILVAEMEAGPQGAPYNWDARLLRYVTSDGGRSWRRRVIHRGCGTDEAVAYDVNGDGNLEIVGKERGEATGIPRIQVWKQRDVRPALTRFRHRLLDRDKPYTGTDILTVDVDGDGLVDVVCGAWWYKNPNWERHDIPGIYQVHTAYDIDGDGAQEIIASKRSPAAGDHWYSGLSSDLVWLKAQDPVNDRWLEYPIGSGAGEWVHGAVVAPVLPGGKLAFIASYHCRVHGPREYPELFEIPDDPTQRPWPSRALVDVPYAEEIVPCDIDGDGKLDLAACSFWMENLGNGGFVPHSYAKKEYMGGRLAVADLNGNGRPDIVVGEGLPDFDNRVSPFSRFLWLENPGGSATGHWEEHVIDTTRCAHSVAAADLDGDGLVEIVCGEHDPFTPYCGRGRLLVYKRAEPQGRAWIQHVVDHRFEHHCGAKVLEVAPGRMAITSHGWSEGRYVHLWELDLGRGR